MEGDRGAGKRPGGSGSRKQTDCDSCVTDKQRGSVLPLRGYVVPHLVKLRNILCKGLIRLVRNICSGKPKTCIS
jgi:hypothetical protein